jgi:hypothetical protein
MTTEFKSMFSWIKSFIAFDATDNTGSTLDFDPAWHGDHWQNLLSSPMDARRYVMEDWTTPKPLAFDETAPLEPAEEAEASA